MEYHQPEVCTIVQLMFMVGTIVHINMYMVNKDTSVFVRRLRSYGLVPYITIHKTNWCQHKSTVLSRWKHFGTLLREVSNDLQLHMYYCLHAKGSVHGYLV